MHEPLPIGEARIRERLREVGAEIVRGHAAGAPAEERIELTTGADPDRSVRRRRRPPARPRRRRGPRRAPGTPVVADHVGFAIDDEFVVGYGLDHDGLFRHLPFVAALELRDGTPRVAGGG